MTFFFDANLSPKIPQILRLLGVDAIHLRERFPADAQDEDWLDEAQGQGWVVITADRRMRTNPATQLVFAQCKVTAVFLTKTILSRNLWDQTLWFLRRWDDIVKAVRKSKPGTCLKAAVAGAIRRLPGNRPV